RESCPGSAHQPQRAGSHMTRLHLSPPHLSGTEAELVQQAIESNWIAPLGPMVDAFEQEFAATVGATHAVALSSGTAALHLALIELGVGPGDEVVTSTLTFAATAFAISYTGATPVFVDCSPESWNIDPGLLAEWLDDRGRKGKLPKAILPVHLYGQSADLEPIIAAAERWGVPVIEDAAEALGSHYHGKAPGTFGRCGVWSFNGNKIITTSGGGMLVTDDARRAARIRKLATQAREPTPHYEHHEIGYNYRLSNISAAIGRAQLVTLEDRVAARRGNFARYHAALGHLNGLDVAAEMPWGRHTRWLTCCTIDAARFGADREAVRVALEAADIEARPVWKPMHEQPVFEGCEVVGGKVASALFRDGLCLPSGSQMTTEDVDRVCAVVRRSAAVDL
ncbi:MAG TPA: aminotransferase class I/II-fold pyridoxal phosphate-dependent enzyme, partial [Gemmatimonadales bacterium]|nr:aminotransferase class I/II-fold pyridoxal phosphate-dependent enzyme [Gemmatimonadales bacterium]